MTVDLARRIAAHAAVAAAFASMAVGGVVPAGAGMAFGLVVAAGFALDGRLSRFAPVLTALAGTALAFLVVLTAQGALDFVVAAAAFAAVLAANRVLARRNAADDGLLYLSALLMLAGGAALSADVLYAACFAAFGVAMTAGLTLSHLSRAAEASRGGRAFLAGPASAARVGTVLALGATTLAGAAAMFAFLPRMTFGVFRPRVAVGGAPLTGFSQRLRLGGHGAIKTDTRVMLRFRLGSLGGPVPTEGEADLLWRGRSYERYEGAEWTKVLEEGIAGSEVRIDGAPTPDARAEVEVLPAAGTTTVFAPGRLASVFDVRPATDRPTGPWRGTFLLADDAGDVTLHRAPEEGYRYSARVALAPVPLVYGRGAAYPDFVRDTYLELPPLDPRVTELSRSLAAPDADPAEVAGAVQRHLRGLEYTTELPGSVADPLAHFLFERRAGHCEYFSTAMAALLRARGIPARNVTGFAGGRYVPEGDYWVLLGGDAHSWTEVYFPGVGFASYDPTPADARAAAPRGFFARLAGALDALQVRWTATVVEYSATDQLHAARRALSALGDLRDRVAMGGLRDLPSLPRRAAAAAVLAAAIAVAIALWRPAVRAGRTGEATRQYLAMLRRLRRQGHVKPPAATATEFCRELSQRGHPAAGEVTAATEAYLAIRFGGRQATAEALRALWRAGRSRPGRAAP